LTEINDESTSIAADNNLHQYNTVSHIQVQQFGKKKIGTCGTCKSGEALLVFTCQEEKCKLKVHVDCPSYHSEYAGEPF